MAAAFADSLTIVDISGIDAPAATIGDISASTIEVTENVDVGNNLYVRNAMNVGPGGLFSSGDITSNGDITASGYIQLGIVASVPPPADDCNAETEAGRMTLNSTFNFLFICSGSSGWVGVALST